MKTPPPARDWFVYSSRKQTETRWQPMTKEDAFDKAAFRWRCRQTVHFDRVRGTEIHSNMRSVKPHISKRLKPHEPKWQEARCGCQLCEEKARIEELRGEVTVVPTTKRPRGRPRSKP